MESRELLIISGYPDMIHNIRAVCGHLGISPTILEWEVATPEMLGVLEELFARQGRPYAIISRGALAYLVARHFPDIVVVRAEPDDVDLMEVLAQAKRYGERAGVLLYAQYAFAFKREVLRQSVGLSELRTYPFHSKSDIERQIRRAQADGMDVAIGGGTLGQRAGEALGYPVLFLETGRRSIHNAVIQAIAVIEARRGESRRLHSLRTVMQAVQEGILTLRDGRITLANGAAAKIFRIEAERMQDRPLAELAPHPVPTALLDFVDGEAGDEEVIPIGAQSYLVRRIDLATPGGAGETMLLLRDVTDIRKQELRVRKRLHSRGLVARYRFEDIIGESPAFAAVLDKARTYAGTDANILIHGESGTGKELFAQSIHNASSRRGEPFVAINCAAIPEALLESELFGYEEGAFTGAKRGGKAGLFELAHGGTIFLDEINSLPIALQGVLLRVIQEKEIRKVGSGPVISVNLRIISATNADIDRRIGESRFRADLFYRLSTLYLSLPPLHQRPEDIPLLTRYFLRRYSERYGTEPRPLAREEDELLRGRVWRGNVRELQNVIHRYVVMSRGGTGGALADCLDHAPPPAGDAPPEPPPGGALETLEREEILRQLERCRWNRGEAAARLGVSRATLWRKMKRYAQTDARFLRGNDGPEG